MIERAHLEQWADMQSAKGDFPELIRRLVYSSVTPYLEKCDIPYGSAVYMGGWDGEVDASKQTEYIPQGKSILEFGTNSSFKTKAESDYAKRSTETGFNKSEITFIFMTPRVWGDKKAWEDEKKEDGIWKDVRVYDSTVLAQWIISTPSVELWFEPLVRIQPEGMVMGEERLEELLTGGEVKLVPSFYTAGREKIAQELMGMLETPTLLAYRASSKEEAMGFILAAGKLFPEKQQKEYYAKTIVVEDRFSFRLMRTQSSMINLVPDFEDATILHRAVSQGKIVLVPLGPGDDFNQLVKELPSPDRFVLEKSLIESGVEEDKARRIIKDCSCNLTMIKKALGFPILRVDWLHDEKLAEIVPALIAERWNENYEGDKEIMSSLSGKSYEDFRTDIVHWSQKPVPPVMNVGALWRITSPLSLWSDLSSLISNDLFELFGTLSKQVLTGEENRYSYQLRQGILNSLVLLAWHGDHFLSGGTSYQHYVNEIIDGVIGNADASRWRIVAKHLPLIAEASPSVFIKEVAGSFERVDSPVMSLFQEENGLYAPESGYPYLLWALESLAWLPEYLLSVSEVLLQLSQKDPGGRLSNRPFNSLVDIYLPWYPQTTATFDERLSVLHILGKKGYAKMWDFLVALLPKNGGHTSGTHQLKWRGYDLIVQKGSTYPEMWKHAEFVCEELMSLYDANDHHLAELVDDLAPIPLSCRQRLISWIKEIVTSIRMPYPETRKQLRETLWLQNNLKGGSLELLSKSEIDQIQAAYNAVTPTDIIERDKWLFDEYAPRIPDFVEDIKDNFSELNELKKQRELAVADWMEHLSVEEIIGIRTMVKLPREYGYSLGHFYEKGGLSERVLELLPIDADEAFVGGYIQGMEGVRGEEDTLKFLDEEKCSYSYKEIARFLHFLVSSPSLFRYVETTPELVQKEYWLKYSGGLYGHFDKDKLYILNKLVSVGRSLDALTNSWHMAKEMPTGLIQDLLMGSLCCPFDINGSMDVLAYESFIEELHKRSDADKETLVKLEWALLPLLRHSSYKDIASSLFEKLQKEPDFFVQLLTFLYKSDNGEDDNMDWTEEERKIKENNAIRAFYLLREWRLIPGVDSSGVVNGHFLRKWITEALDMAQKVDRVKYVYAQLGEVFAKYPENKDNPNWPPTELFAVMEELNSEELFNNYSIGMFNKRGFTTRGGYDGGDIERENASYFKDLRMQCLPLYPHVAKVFGDLSEQYTRMAKEMDDQATIAKLDF